METEKDKLLSALSDSPAEVSDAIRIGEPPREIRACKMPALGSSSRSVSEVDYFAMYCLETAGGYLIPIGDIPLRRQAALNQL